MLDFCLIPMWTYVMGLPLIHLNEKNVKLVGSLFPNFLEIDQVDLFGSAMKVFLRIKMLINVNDPILLGFWYPNNKDKCVNSFILRMRKLLTYVLDLGNWHIPLKSVEKLSIEPKLLIVGWCQYLILCSKCILFFLEDLFYAQFMRDVTACLVI